VHASTVASGERDSVSVVFFCFSNAVGLLGYTPSATGALSVVVDSMQMLLGRRVGWCPGITPFGHIEGLASGSDVAVTVEPETPFLFRSLWLKVSEVGEWGQGEGGRGKKKGREE